MKRTLWSIAALLAAALFAAPAVAQKKPIVIGAALALTGNLADSGEHVRKAFALWQEEVNAKGGLLGRPVEVKIYDDRSDGARDQVRILASRLDDQVHRKQADSKARGLLRQVQRHNRRHRR